MNGNSINIALIQIPTILETSLRVLFASSYIGHMTGNDLTAILLPATIFNAAFGVSPYT